MASRTVFVVGTMLQDFTFHISYMQAFQAQEHPNQIVEELAQLCRELRVDSIAADGNGNGHVFNRILYSKFPPPKGFYGIFYSSTDQPVTPDGALYRVTLSRSRSIGGLLSRVKCKRLLFPQQQACDPFLDEFACETAEYDDHTRALSTRTLRINATMHFTRPITHYGLGFVAMVRRLIQTELPNMTRGLSAGFVRRADSRWPCPTSPTAHPCKRHAMVATAQDHERGRPRPKPRNTSL